MSIRKDTRQWMIYDEDSVRAVEGAVEIFLMGLGAAGLVNNDDVVLRAMGHLGLKVSQTRLELWSGERRGEPSTEIRKELASYLNRIISWMGGRGERPDDALDEMHAAIVWLDKRSRAAGVAGDGWYREVVKESQSGR